MVWRVTSALYLRSRLPSGILCRPDFYAHQRVGRVDDIRTDVNAVDLFYLQK